MYLYTYIGIPYVLKFLQGLTFIFANWKPSTKVYTRKNLDQALVQWQIMAVHKYKTRKSLKAKIHEISPLQKLKLILWFIQWNLYFTNQLGIDLFVKSKSTYNRILLSNQLNSTYVAYNTQAHYRKPVIHLRSHVVRRKRSYLCLRPDTGMPWKHFWVNHRYKALSRLESVAFYCPSLLTYFSMFHLRNKLHQFVFAFLYVTNSGLSYP